jgi:hypothetical protein
MGKIGGLSAHAGSHISALLGTTKISTKSLVFRKVVAGKGLPRDVSAGLGTGALLKARKTGQSGLLVLPTGRSSCETLGSNKSNVTGCKRAPRYDAKMA